MKLSFLPGDLHCSQDVDGYYSVILAGKEVMRTRSKRAALNRFNHLREELESHFPAHEMSPERKAELFQKYVGDKLVPHNGSRHQKRTLKRGSTRTFG